MAFPSTSTGAFGDLLAEAAAVTVGALCDALRAFGRPPQVTFVRFDDAAPSEGGAPCRGARPARRRGARDP